MSYSIINQLQGGEPFPGTGTDAAAPVTGNVYYSIPITPPTGKAISAFFITLGIMTGLSGAPTSGGFTAKFQVWVPNTKPASEQDSYATGIYVDVDPTTQPEMFPDGWRGWPTDLSLGAFDTLATPKTTMRRIQTALKHRVVITSTLAGGTTVVGAPLALRSVVSVD